MGEREGYLTVSVGFDVPMRPFAILAMTLACALLSGPARAQLISPGALARAHAKVDEEDACGRCHAQGRKVVESGCLDCHKEVAKGLRARKGFHQKQARASGKGCEGCHSEHHGRDFPLIRWDPKKAGFKHEMTGFALEDAHATLECKDCHGKVKARYMGLEQACRSCHEDPHKPSLGKRCASCHNAVKFRPAPGFDHKDARFHLEGAHEEVPCARCHEGKGKDQRFRGVKFASCGSCHEDPHGGAMKPKACKDCHTTKSFAEIRGAQRSDHAPQTFPLVGKHAKVACARCHAPNTPPELAPRACKSCHKSPHRANLGQACSSCHKAYGWRAVSSKSFPHQRTGFALLGKHGALRCTRCHASKGSFKARFLNKASDRCMRCHENPHTEAWKSTEDPLKCEGCHTVAGFVPSTFGSAAHQGLDFPLEGSHLAVQCASCHRKRAPRAEDAQPEISPRGSVPFAPHPSSADCASCHENPHGEALAKEIAQGGCKSCHSPAGWSEARFNHDTTDFPLREAHAKAPCVACHKRAGDGRFDKPSAACRDCHGDPHLGQFAATEPVKGCPRCHVDKAWKPPVFDHATDARFPLEGKHEGAKCAACHQARETAQGSVVVYRNGRLKCAQCHEDHHGHDKKGQP